MTTNQQQNPDNRARLSSGSTPRTQASPTFPTNSVPPRKKYKVVRRKRVRGRKVRRKFHKGLRGRKGNGLSRQDFGKEGGKKLENGHSDSYGKRHQEKAAQARHGTFDEAQAHKSYNKEQHYYRTFFKDQDKKKNKFFDVYNEGGYHNKENEAFVSYDGDSYEQKQRKNKAKKEEGGNHREKSDYDRLKAISDSIIYGGRKGTEDFFTHLKEYGNQKASTAKKKHKYREGI